MNIIIITNVIITIILSIIIFLHFSPSDQTQNQYTSETQAQSSPPVTTSTETYYTPG